ncbi:MAG: hypothetical protein CME70_14615 [Halobacteriovorax sp.]|nr:hypothetical protein [Halobacteriovorax sp.]|tara:strand:+ start:210683 stop:213772 length:3090 start_codon:yes stop_codon:yes gene_type:complete
MVFFYKGNEYLVEREFELMEEKANSMAPILTSGVSSALQDANFLAKDPLIKTINQAIDENIDETFSFVEDNLKNFLDSKKDILRISLFVGENNTRTYMSVSRKGKGTSTTTDEVFNLRAITQRRDSYLTSIRLFNKKNEPFIGIVTPIKNKKKVIGFIKIDFNLDRNFIQLRNELDQKYSLYIFNSDGDYLYHPNSSKSFGFENGLRYLVQSDYPETEAFVYGRSHFFKDEVGKNLFYSKKIPLLPGDMNKYVSLGISRPKRLVVSQNIVFKKPTIIWTLAILALTTLSAWYFSRYLTKNIAKITQYAQDFARGKTDLDISINSNDEIGVLALSFQGMIRQVNERTRILKKSERETRIAKDQLESISRGKSLLLKDLRKQKDEIEKIGRDKDELLAIVSHDLKNPLAVIETAMDLLHEELMGHSLSAEDLIKRSKHSAKFALDLITDLLDMARLEGGIKLDYERFNVEELVEDSIQNYQLKAKEKNINIKYDFEDDFVLLGDYGRIIQVINNIIGNALKFTPEGGQIRIEGKAICDLNESEEESLKISISDTGPGIPEDKIESIFNKYEQARVKDREIGTGLGLAICKNIIELHNGKVWVESVEGEGAVFHFILPKVTRGKITDHIRVPRVMIVDDNKEFFDSLNSHPSHDDFIFVHSAQGLDAEEIAKIERVDIVLIDLEMKYVDGIDILKRLKTSPSFKNIPLIVLAESIKTEFLSDLNMLANDFAKKSMGIDHVVDKITEYLRPTTELSGIQRLSKELPTVLVVDDDENVREIIVDSLNDQELNVLWAKSGLEALFLVKKYPVNLVLTDLRMPEIDGLKLSQMVNTQNSGIEIILMSGTIVELPEEVKKKFNVHSLVSKPFNVLELSQTVAKIAKENKYGSTENKIIPFKSKPALEKENYKVLFVDDAEDMHMLFKVMMKKYPVEVTYCLNGEEGLNKYMEDSFDLILMDVNMPVMDGKTAISKIREYEAKCESEKVEAWAITANDSTEEVQILLESGFSDYMGKPIKKEKIIEFLLPEDKIKKIS